MLGTTQRPTTSWQVGSASHDFLERYVNSLDTETGKYSMTVDEAIQFSLSLHHYRPHVVREASELIKSWLNHPNNPLPSPSKIIATELSFGPKGDKIRGRSVHEHVHFESGLQIHGIIDILWEDDNGTIIVGDYKSQRSWITPQDLENKVQAMCYALAIHKMFPERPLRVEFYLLRYPNNPIVWAPTEDSFTEMENILLGYQRRILSDTDYVATPGKGCKWCEYNYTCKAFQAWSTVEPENNPLWYNMPLEDLMPALDEWFDRYTSVKNVYDEIKSLAHEHMDRMNLKEEGNWKITRKSYHNYADEVQSIIWEHGGVKNLPPELKADLSPWKQTSFGRPFLKKVKGW